MADPTSRFSFLNWLKLSGRLYPFYIREDFHALRREFNDYYRWAASELDNLRWNSTVTAVVYDAETDVFTVTVTGDDGPYRARHVVVGVGTEATLPESIAHCGGPIIHTEHYLQKKPELLSDSRIAVVGSGQSAAEVYLDLLEEQEQYGFHLDWITRSPRFFPMEDTKLTLEMTSPEYTDYFHALPMERRDQLVRLQRGLYKGISADFIQRIYDTLYEHSTRRNLNTTLLTATEVTKVDWDAGAQEFTLHLKNYETGATAHWTASHIVAATGYQPRSMDFLSPLGELIKRDERGRLAVERYYDVDTLGGRVFVQNGEEHTHGLTAPDLGMGAWRNSTILRRISGKDIYPVEQSIAFQNFDFPGR